jgi:PAS domain-containing protein
MKEALLATDSAGVVTHLNPAGELLLAAPASAVTGRPSSEVVDIVNEVSGRSLPDPVASVLQTGIPVYLTGQNALRVDGQLTPIAGSAAPITGPGGDIVGAVLVFRDSTVERETTRRLRKLLARAKPGATSDSDENRL